MDESTIVSICEAAGAAFSNALTQATSKITADGDGSMKAITIVPVVPVTVIILNGTSFFRAKQKADV